MSAGDWSKRKANVPTQAHLLDSSSDRLNRNHTFSHGQRRFAVIWLLAAKQVHTYTRIHICNSLLARQLIFPSNKVFPNFWLEPENNSIDVDVVPLPVVVAGIAVVTVVTVALVRCHDKRMRHSPSSLRPKSKCYLNYDHDLARKPRPSLELP